MRLCYLNIYHFFNELWLFQIKILSFATFAGLPVGTLRFAHPTMILQP